MTSRADGFRPDWIFRCPLNLEPGGQAGTDHQHGHSRRTPRTICVVSGLSHCDGRSVFEESHQPSSAGSCGCPRCKSAWIAGSGDRITHSRAGRRFSPHRSFDDSLEQRAKSSPRPRHAECRVSSIDARPCPKQHGRGLDRANGSRSGIRSPAGACSGGGKDDVGSGMLVLSLHHTCRCITLEPVNRFSHSIQGNFV